MKQNCGISSGVEADEGGGILSGWGIGAGIGAGGGAGGEVLAQKKDARMGNFWRSIRECCFQYTSEYDVVPRRNAKLVYRSDMREASMMLDS